MELPIGVCLGDSTPSNITQRKSPEAGQLSQMSELSQQLSSATPYSGLRRGPQPPCRFLSPLPRPEGERETSPALGKRGAG